jgi:hypothetical protein
LRARKVESVLRLGKPPSVVGWRGCLPERIDDLVGRCPVIPEGWRSAARLGGLVRREVPWHLDRRNIRRRDGTIERTKGNRRRRFAVRQAFPLDVRVESLTYICALRSVGALGARRNDRRGRRDARFLERDRLKTGAVC